MFSRRATIADYEALFHLMLKLDFDSKYMLLEPYERLEHKEKELKKIYEYLGSEHHVIFFLTDGIELLGYIHGERGQYRRNMHTLSIVIGILDKYTGIGYGRLLLNEIENWAVNNEVSRIELTTMKNNHKAVKFYIKNGFQSEGVRRGSLIVDGILTDEYIFSKVMNL